MPRRTYDPRKNRGRPQPPLLNLAALAAELAKLTRTTYRPRENR